MKFGLRIIFIQKYAVVQKRLKLMFICMLLFVSICDDLSVLIFKFIKNIIFNKQSCS